MTGAAALVMLVSGTIWLDLVDGGGYLYSSFIFSRPHPSTFLVHHVSWVSTAQL